jgi:hypothetical protein
MLVHQPLAFGAQPSVFGPLDHQQHSRHFVPCSTVRIGHQEILGLGQGARVGAKPPAPAAPPPHRDSPPMSPPPYSFQRASQGPAPKAKLLF